MTHDRNWWKVRNNAGHEGYVPKTFLQTLSGTPVDTIVFQEGTYMHVPPGHPAGIPFLPGPQPFLPGQLIPNQQHFANQHFANQQQFPGQPGQTGLFSHNTNLQFQQQDVAPLAPLPTQSAPAQAAAPVQPAAAEEASV